MNILEKIIAYKKEVVEEQKKVIGLSLDELKVECEKKPPIISFEQRLKSNCQNNKVSLIAEVKKASPSKGIIREDFNPLEIALDYEKAGADAISVLTDEKFFQGSIDYLLEIKKYINIPVLRKDFIVDPFQVYHSRLLGADMILLIVSALESKELRELYKIATDIGLEVLVETHDKQEFDIAYELGAKIIGINNRNLKTFELSLNNTVDIIKDRAIENRFIISESGIFTNEDITYLQNYKVSGILVGESLMRQDNIYNSVKKLMNK
ncbi:MAG: indole-3-glycerol phosphate synthase TrpC [bacterium]